ncbi:SRPBCC family protein [Georgenia sp. Z1491]|uniref:SRPBCC family protein n=1 Tax=Georgenia sp. Z1491 TaxID=3416707 RepID=UPI003CF824F4
MELTNAFTVDLPVDDTFRTLEQLERVMPCVPGGAIERVDGEDYHGIVKIKVGPVSTKYSGVARFVEKDAENHRAVIRAAGTDVGGQGGVEALFTVTLEEHGGGTRVQVDTDLNLSGRVAGFGRGIVADVAGKILSRFAKNLQEELASGSLAAPSDPGSVQPGAGDGAAAGAKDGTPQAASRPTARSSSADDVEPLDVMSIGPAVAKYLLPVAGALAVLGLGAALLRRRGGSGSGAGGWPAGGLHIHVTLPQGAWQAVPVPTDHTWGEQ